MLLTASAEFIDLCRAQVTLLTQGFGASSSAVYLTEERSDTAQTELIPIFVFPETRAEQEERLLPGAGLPSLPQERPNPPTLVEGGELRAVSKFHLPQVEQIVLPLIHNNLVLGFLVVGREDRPWWDWEQQQLEQVAHTLAIACLLDQRHQWLEQSHYQQRSMQQQQYSLLANLLHQIRNPLSTIRTLGKLLLKRFLPEDPNRNLASSIVQESERLQGLLQQFDQAIDLGEAALEDLALPIESSRLTTPTQQILLPAAPTTGELQLQPCSLAELLTPLLLSATAIAQANQLDLQTQIETGPLPPVTVDPQALKEALSNLIDNALKYTPAGGKVVIKLSRDPAQQQQCLTISDSGPGIPAQDLPHIFERHYRGVQAEGKLPGTGLGLAIARHLIEQMQGRIEVISPARPHESAAGTMFMVFLPETDTTAAHFPAELPEP
uniref:histidine kinase n=1 Tax=Cyanothece sp. (strain PCC 7425 / ATCC 29141) TaxID=395961 RepID=B8HRU0_CYAP4